MPRSGKSAELMAAYGIDADAIVRAVRQLVGAEVAAS
jgi:transketolase C-terminal domain/subunit